MIDLTTDPIDLQAVLAAVTKPQCGAEVLFVGTTRQWTDGIETKCLYYEAYREMAFKELARLEQEARKQWPVEEVVIVHRLGDVAVREASVAVAVGAAHRDAAFLAARWIIDQVKVSVPIWKRDQSPTDTTWVHPK